MEKTEIIRGSVGLASKSPMSTVENIFQVMVPLRPETKPQTFVDAFIEYYDALTDTPKAFVEIFALRSLAIAIGRHEINITPKPLCTNLHIIFAGKSGKSKKSTAIELGADLFPKESQKTTDSYTPESLFEQLYQHPEARNEWDECSTCLSQFNNPKNYYSGISENLMRLYSCPEELSYGTKGGGEKVIRKPYFNFLWATTDKKFLRHVRAENIDDGFLAKTLVVYGEAAKYSRPRKNLDEVPQSSEQKQCLTKTLDRVWRIFHTVDFSFKFASDALAFFNKKYRELEDQNLKIKDYDFQELQDAILPRYGEYMIKFAALYEVDRLISVPNGFDRLSEFSDLVIDITLPSIRKSYNFIMKLLDLLNTKLLTLLNKGRLSRNLVKLSRLLANREWHMRSKIMPYLNLRNVREFNDLISEAERQRMIERKKESKAEWYRLLTTYDEVTKGK